MSTRGRRDVLRDGGGALAAASVLTHLSFSRLRTGEQTEPRLIGHRGCAAEFPENTLIAVENAAETVDAIEIDLRRAATGEVVVIHDATVDRVTNGTGAVADLTASELQTLSVLETDVGVPLLEDIFEVVPAAVDVVLDLKVSGLVDDVLETVAAHPHDVLLSSFEPSIVRTATKAGADTALILRESMIARPFRLVGTTVPIYPRQDVAGMIDQAVSLDCVAIHPRLELCLRTSLVERAHERDLRVEPWTVDTVEVGDQLRSSGVDGLITDVCTGLS
ncbi:glycerophosphodiester phosphodiesterase [Natronolimnobius sp. AArcel1]|uniref:glycerophosphodiester phosphodiesterase n=1 Tax=Natronolimnobius sp. AArcel1 TaxID=1679093 RepID=UPI0013EB615F|nr:glycerophosphodiester phosphodiesterase [Natronolimnobius sp. AArcel1]NGM70548.1 glycerophosphodiester phosphodiesterase [Natronolimnobius sp. AArcel1]